MYYKSWGYAAFLGRSQIFDCHAVHKSIRSQDMRLLHFSATVQCHKSCSQEHFMGNVCLCLLLFCLLPLLKCHT